MSDAMATHPAPGVMQTIGVALASAPRKTRRMLAGIWILGAAVIAVQLLLDFDGFAYPLEVAEAAGVMLGMLGMGVLGSVLFLQRAQQCAFGETSAARTEIQSPTQIVVVLPVVAAAGGAALAMAIGITVVRALLGSPVHYAIAALMTTYLTVVGRIVFGVTRSLYVYGQRQAAAFERSRAEATEARLVALHAQLNPHFLFNTLNTIASLVRSDARAAERTVENLGNVLRRTLDRTMTPMSTIADEVDYVRACLAIEKERFGERLQVDWDVDPALAERRVPTMTLQPLVENALKHGVGARLDGGRIRVVIKEGPDGLRLSVQDDGPGFAPRFREGVGLGNLRRRIEETYGDSASLRVSGVVGARVDVVLPPAPTGRTP